MRGQGPRTQEAAGGHGCCPAAGCVCRHPAAESPGQPPEQGLDPPGPLPLPLLCSALLPGGADEAGCLKQTQRPPAERPHPEGAAAGAAGEPRPGLTSTSSLLSPPPPPCSQVRELQRLLRNREARPPSIRRAATQPAPGRIHALLELKVQRLEAELENRSQDARSSFQAMEQRFHRVKVEAPRVRVRVRVKDRDNPLWAGALRAAPA